MTLVEKVLRKAEWQQVLFAEQPRRAALSELVPDWPCRDIRITVHRNHAFEHVAEAMKPYLAFADMTPRFILGPYDDSLSYAATGGEDADVEIMWLDLDRYRYLDKGLDIDGWLLDRIRARRVQTDAWILIAPMTVDGKSVVRLRSATDELAGVRVMDPQPLMASLASRYYDQRAALYSGTRLSDAANLLTAREIACRCIPAMLKPRIKAIAVDLDNTLFDGVLGEDGNNVQLTEGHRLLQQRLASFRDEGVFLAVVSRNEESDVRELFRQRDDFPLRWGFFSASSVNWGGKGEGIRHVLQHLRIGANALLFLDDNPGELARVAAEVEGIMTVRAMPDAFSTLRILDFYPGLWAWTHTTVDAVRVADLEGERVREQLKLQVKSPREYVKSLDVQLTVEVTPRWHLARLHELSQKTNQFNCNVARLSEVAMARLMASDMSRVVAISLRDRLSDSGVVGLVVAELSADRLRISELAISCRALGRRVEDTMIAAALTAILDDLPASTVEFMYRAAPRNRPALDWLSRFTGQVVADEGTVILSSDAVKSIMNEAIVNVEKKHG